MSVRKINSRFVGLRVQRQIPGEARPRVKNFSFRIPVRRGHITAWRDASASEQETLTAKAIQLDTQWEQEQATARKAQAKPFDPFENARTNTGIVGIRYVWTKDSEGYDVEGFWINVSHNKKTYTQSVRLKNRKWADGWKIAAEKLGAIKGLTPAVVKKIIRKRPVEAQLRCASAAVFAKRNGG